MVRQAHHEDSSNLILSLSTCLCEAEAASLRRRQEDEVVAANSFSVPLWFHFFAAWPHGSTGSPCGFYFLVSAQDKRIGGLPAGIDPDRLGLEIGVDRFLPAFPADAAA